MFAIQSNEIAKFGDDAIWLHYGSSEVCLINGLDTNY